MASNDFLLTSMTLSLRQLSSRRASPLRYAWRESGEYSLRHARIILGSR
jgi:hypothetical protein